MNMPCGKNKGFTLIEVVVALCVAAVLFASMIATMSPIYRIYARTRERSDAQLVAGTVIDSLRATCANARTLTAPDEGTLLINGSSAFTVSQEGYLLFDENIHEAPGADLVLSSGAYNGKTVSFLCEAVDSRENVVRVVVTVRGDEGAASTLTSVISSMRAVLNTPIPIP